MEIGNVVSYFDGIGCGHEALVGSHVEAALLIAGAAWLVTVQAVGLENWENVAFETGVIGPGIRYPQSNKKHRRKSGTR